MKCYKYENVSKNPKAYLWTGDHQIEPITVIDCDFDKYITYLGINGEVQSCKWGYVYSNFKDALFMAALDPSDWDTPTPDCFNPWKELLSNKDYARFVKTKRKEKLAQNDWCVCKDNENIYEGKHFKTLKRALNYFGKLDEKGVEYAVLFEANTSVHLLEVEDHQVYWLEPTKWGRRTHLKSFHLGRTTTYKQWRK